MQALFLKVRKLLQIIARREFRVALWKGAAAGVEHLPLLYALPCNLVVDAGANRGQFALVARAALPKARILAFEPLDEPAAIFRRVFAADPLVTLHPVALGEADNQLTMHVSAADDSSSLLPITEAQTALFPGTGEREQRTVHVAPLTKFISPSEVPAKALLKIDVKGYELTVLRGCGSLLRKFTHVYVECSFAELYEGQAVAHQVVGWLSQRGFNLAGVYNLAYDRRGSAIQGDFLFAKDVHADG